MSLLSETVPEPMTPATRAVWSRLTRAGAAMHNAGALHYIVALFSVQGLAYLTQFAIARIAGPADFAVVRTVESTLNVLLVVASLGMPMLAVTTIAALRDESAQGRMVGTLITISVAGGVVVALLASVGASALDPPVRGYLRAMAWIMALTAASRTCLNYFQGRQLMQRVAGFSVLLALVALVIVVLAAYSAGLNGWVVGRYVSEVLFLAMMLRAIGPSLSFVGPVPSGQPVGAILASGTGIAASLLVRTAGDNAGVFLLNAVGADRVSIGYFGLSSLVLVAVLIVPGAIPSVALPRLVARLGDPIAVRALVRRVGIGALGASMVLAILTAALAGPMVSLILPTYGPAVPLLYTLMLAVPFRLVSSMAGMVLVACGRVRYTVWINVLALVVTCGSGFALSTRQGAIGAAVAVVLGEIVSAVAYILAAQHALSEAQRSTNGGAVSAAT
jgi:O-antigen/teichoic acid export membrane protein